MGSFLLRRTRAEEDAPENPWLRLDEPKTAPLPAPPPPTFELPEIQQTPTITAPALEHRLPSRQITVEELGVTLWWLAAHGGAGESTLAGLVEGSQAAEHAWPLGGQHGARDVVLLGRTSYSGLTAVQHALADWGSGRITVNLRALVLLADAPGKLPRPLRDSVRVLQQAAPGPACLIPWQEAWRLGVTDPKTVHKHLASIITPKEGTT